MSPGRAAPIRTPGPEISGTLAAELQVPRDDPPPAPPSPGQSAPVEAPSREARLSRMMRDGFDSVWRLLRRLGVPASAAEDAAQEVFVVAARRIDQIALGSERSYLFGTALRVAKGFQRRGAREALRLAPLDEAKLPGPATPEQLLDEQQQLELLDRTLAALSEEERSVFVLFELEGLTLSEISELTNIPRGTVASRLRRARTRFVRALAARRRGRPDAGGGPHG